MLNLDDQMVPAMNIKGKAQYDVSQDIWTILRPLETAGFVWNGRTNTMEQPGNPTIQPQTPWVHTKGDPLNHCGLDHRVIFQNYKVIPPRCHNCWKVCVAPKTFKQLMELEQLQVVLNVPSKCGIEVRNYTTKSYGGYFYTHSLQRGLERYKEVRNLVNTVLTDGEDVDVILKRGCTEFELLKGPSQDWELTSEDQALCDLIEAYVIVERGDLSQPDFIKAHVRTTWMVWAYGLNDQTYLEYNGGEPLFPTCTTYHNYEYETDEGE
jgi:hypothetical protein